MTVGELIDRLEKSDRKLRVFVAGYEWGLDMVEMAGEIDVVGPVESPAHFAGEYRAAEDRRFQRVPVDTFRGVYIGSSRHTPGGQLETLLDKLMVEDDSPEEDGHVNGHAPSDGESASKG